MSTPYNNQWVLGRLRARWRRRAHAAGSSVLGQPCGPLPEQLPEQPPEESHEPPPPPSSRSRTKRVPRSPAHGARERPRTAPSRTARKHPRWIDRDT